MSLVGTVLQGKLDAYEIEEVFVSGRFGQTFLGRRVSDGDDVVVKTIRLDQESSWSTLDTFERENERLRNLAHPSIAPYLDAIVWRDGEETLLGLVQAYITTPSLRAWSQGRGLVDLDRCLDWFEKTLEALVYMHELKPPVVHGDLDAGNILLSDHYTVQIVDFATVRQALLKPSTLASGLAVGSLDYAPMEQLLGKIFPSSDLYALAMTFLSVLSKLEPPEFPLDGMRPAIGQLLPYDTPESLRTLLHQMTEPDPQHRLGSARIALERLRTGRLDGPGRATAQGVDTSPEPRHVARVTPPPAKPGNVSARQEILRRLERRVSPLYEEHHKLKAWKMEFTPKYERVHAFGIARDGVTMAVAYNHDAYVMDATQLRMKGNVECSELARRVAISRDGKRVAILTGFEQLLFYEVNVSLWKVHEVIVEGMWPGNSQLTFSPDGSRVAISDDDQVNLYEWASGKQLAKWEVDGQYALEFEPHGERLFASGATHTSALALDGEMWTHAASAFAFSPDGSQLAVAQGNAITCGHVAALTSGVKWAPDEVTIALPAGLKGRRVHILRFSPDQRVLFAGCAEGGWVLVDLIAREVLEFHDQRRCQDTEHVKIFEVGFSADSMRLLLHGTLHPDEFGHDRIGSVLAWKIPTGRFLGSLLWLDDELSIMSAQGFHGEISEASSRGFSSSPWARPDVASAMFAGRDVGGMLDAGERASLDEFLQRYAHVSEVASVSELSFDVNEATDALAGLSHVATMVFSRADEAYARSLERADHLNHGDYLAALEDTAFQVDVDYDDEEMMVLHRELLAAEVAAEVPVEPVEQAPVASGPSRKSSTAEPRPQAPAPRAEPPSRGLDDEERPLTARRGLSAPLSDIHNNHDHETPQTREAQASTGSSAFMRLAVATILGFGLTGLFVVFAMEDSAMGTRQAVFGGSGLLLTLAFHFGLLRQLMGR